MDTYKRHRFPLTVISYESIRLWVIKFGSEYTGIGSIYPGELIYRNLSRLPLWPTGRKSSFRGRWCRS